MRRVRREAVEPDKLDRLLEIVKLRKGHELLGCVEDAKIALSTRERAEIGLAELSAGLSLEIAVAQFEQAIGPALGKSSPRRARPEPAGPCGRRHQYGVHRRLQRHPELQGGARGRGSDARMVEGDAFGSVAAASRSMPSANSAAGVDIASGLSAARWCGAGTLLIKYYAESHGRFRACQAPLRIIRKRRFIPIIARFARGSGGTSLLHDLRIATADGDMTGSSLELAA